VQTKVLRGGVVPAEESRAGVLKTLRAASGEVICNGSRDKAFELKMSGGGAELLHVSYSPTTHSFLADGKEIKLETGDAPTIHAFVDGSVIEVILGELIGYTKRFYYTSATAPDIAVLANGDSSVTLDAWRMLPISNNRLTTPASA
jgi:beta-fructofuranosidase